MWTRLRFWFQHRPRYVRRPPLLLINGLAEQAESWYCNADAWRRQFDVHMPNLLAYAGTPLHRRLQAALPVDVGYLVERLHTYIEEFVQTAPCHLVANSLGGKIGVEFAVQYPHLVNRLVLLCPSGLAMEERLPLVEGVWRGDVAAVVRSVFRTPWYADPQLLTYYERQFANRHWRSGLLRTLRGTMAHRVRDLLPHVQQPTLLVVGRDDLIVDPQEAISAAALLPRGRLVVLERCGHAPQIEQARVVNRLVVQFLNERSEESLESNGQMA
jgi:pimeloyl-ACP methyl ester carboxylesterase